MITADYVYYNYDLSRTLYLDLDLDTSIFCDFFLGDLAWTDSFYYLTRKPIF
jgi:hypothetical protein